MHELTKTTIETLSDEQVRILLHLKWVEPLHEQLLSMPNTIVDNLFTKVNGLVAKYNTGLVEVEQQIADASKGLSLMLNNLTGSKFDMKAFGELNSLLSRDSLELIKMVSLEKMFPIPGATTPEVRFKSFKGDWAVRPIFEIFTKEAEKGHPELPVLSASQELGMINRDSIGISMQYSKQNTYSYKRVRPGRFVIHLRSFQGGFAHSAIDGITSPAYTVLSLKDPEQHSDLFWKFLFTSPMFIKRLEVVTYGIRDGRSISVDDFFNLSFCFPLDPKEQIYIAEFFSRLDTLISAQEQKLGKLRSLKKSFLEKMFVALP